MTKDYSELKPGAKTYLELKSRVANGISFKSTHLAQALQYLRECPLEEIPRFVNHKSSVVKDIVQSRLKKG